MSIEILRGLVKSACTDGTLNDGERAYLLDEAAKLGISSQQLEFMINSELQAIVAGKNNASGFVQQQTPIANNVSGFVTNEASGFVQQTSSTSSGVEFTDITAFKKQGGMSLMQSAKLYGKRVLIKRLRPEFVNDAKYNELFYKEFENAYHLDHNHIVRLLGKGSDAQGAFYYMEYIDGRTLTEMIQPDKGLADIGLVKKISLEILSALEYVHKKQMVHRDLKPDNILVSYNGDNVKITDFGLAMSDSFDDNLAKVGTPRYAAPEQMQRDAHIDQRADIYAFGLILCEMLTGNTAYPSLVRAQSEALYQIVMRCTAKEPLARYQNCKQIADEIEKALAQSSASQQAKAKKTDGTLKKYRLPIIISSVLIAIVVVSLMFFNPNHTQSVKNDMLGNEQTRIFQGMLNGRARRVILFNIKPENGRIAFQYTIIGQGDSHKNKSGFIMMNNSEYFIDFETIGKGKLQKNKDNYMITAVDSSNFQWSFESEIK